MSYTTILSNLFSPVFFSPVLTIQQFIELLQTDCIYCLCNHSYCPQCWQLAIIVLISLAHLAILLLIYQLIQFTWRNFCVVPQLNHYWSSWCMTVLHTKKTLVSRLNLYSPTIRSLSSRYRVWLVFLMYVGIWQRPQQSTKEKPGM